MTMVVIFVRCSGESLAEPTAAPSPVPGLPSSGDLPDDDAAPVPLSAAPFVLLDFKFASDEPFAAPPAGVLLSTSSVWLFSLSDLGAAACPVVSGAFRWPDFKVGAIFSAGAFCCTAGAPDLSSAFMPCAKTPPAPKSNTAAVVDNSRRFLMDVSFGQSVLLTFLDASKDNVGRLR
jgi:hypothetical protein